MLITGSSRRQLKRRVRQTFVLSGAQFMKLASVLITLAALFSAGCAEQTKDAPKSSGGAAHSSSATHSSTASHSDAKSGSGRGAPVAPSGVVQLTPDNTKIEFIGTHTPPKDPEPRTGTFEKFTGTAQMDAEGKTLKSVVLEVDTASLQTPIEKLTNHLRSEDFFDVEQHPTAKFESSNITAGEVTGTLTLLGNTKEITFPAEVKIDGNNLEVRASFKIDRTEFGMDKLQEGVEKEVTINITVGPKS
jgi:polyisoprenoid-binding protein YceI